MTRDDLILSIENGHTPKWLHFWGHTPDKSGSLTKTCFSQWWSAHPFTVDGVRYATAEHFMMAQKALLFGDQDLLPKILAASSPAIAKKLGRLVSNFDETKWCAARYQIVILANTAKFAQHPDLKEFLLQTGNRIIVEASPFDRIWGVGLAASHPDAENPVKWKGLNLLGFALMDVRSHLNSTRDPS